MIRWFYFFWDFAYAVVRILLLSPFLLLGRYMLCFVQIYQGFFAQKLVKQWWFFVFCLVIVILMRFLYIGWQRETKQNLLCNFRLELLEKNLWEMKRIQEERAIWCHDIRHHHTILYGLIEKGEKEKALAYLKELGASGISGGILDFVNHDLLNLLLNIKFREAEQEKILIQCRFEDMEKMKIEPLEICELFANLLDNAIEANKKLEQEKRWLRVSCIRNGRMLCLSVANPVKQGIINWPDGRLSTTKEKKGDHGFGICSMQKVVERYGGNMKTEINGEIFSQKIYLAGFNDDN